MFDKTRKQAEAGRPAVDPRRVIGAVTDRDLSMYCKGWNASLSVAIEILQDFIQLKEEDLSGLGISQQAPR